MSDYDHISIWESKKNALSRVIGKNLLYISNIQTLNAYNIQTMQSLDISMLWDIHGETLIRM